MRISDWSSDVCSSDLFHFIQNQHQTCKSAVPKNQQQALQEPKRTEVIDITLDAGRALYGRSHVRLPGHPCNQATGQRQIGRASCRGKSVSLRVDLGGRRIITKKKTTEYSNKIQ